MWFTYCGISGSERAMSSSKQPKIQMNKSKQQQQDNPKVNEGVQQWLPGNYIFLYWESLRPVSKVWLVVKLSPFWLWASLQTRWSEEPSSCKTVQRTHPSSYLCSYTLKEMTPRKVGWGRSSQSWERNCCLRAGASAAQLSKFWTSGKSVKPSLSPWQRCPLVTRYRSKLWKKVCPI